jgi:hypothetical protein
MTALGDRILWRFAELRVEQRVNLGSRRWKRISDVVAVFEKARRLQKARILVDNR